MKENNELTASSYSPFLRANYSELLQKLTLPKLSLGSLNKIQSSVLPIFLSRLFSMILNQKKQHSWALSQAVLV